MSALSHDVQKRAGARFFRIFKCKLRTLFSGICEIYSEIVYALLGIKEAVSLTLAGNLRAILIKERQHSLYLFFGRCVIIQSFITEKLSLVRRIEKVFEIQSIIVIDALIVCIESLCVIPCLSVNVSELK